MRVVFPEPLHPTIPSTRALLMTWAIYYRKRRASAVVTLRLSSEFEGPQSQEDRRNWNPDYEPMVNEEGREGRSAGVCRKGVQERAGAHPLIASDWQARERASGRHQNVYQIRGEDDCVDA